MTQFSEGYRKYWTKRLAESAEADAERARGHVSHNNTLGQPRYKEGQIVVYISVKEGLLKVDKGKIQEIYKQEVNAGQKINFYYFLDSYKNFILEDFISDQPAFFQVGFDWSPRYDKKGRKVERDYFGLPYIIKRKENNYSTDEVWNRIYESKWYQRQLSKELHKQFARQDEINALIKTAK
jgi:hypothetical protein